MLHGTDCGNTPVEAANRVHDSFEKQVRNWTMKKQEGADVLKDMQVLYSGEFPRAYDWEGDKKHYTYPPTDDPALLNGQPLISAGRTTALMFWDLSQNKALVHHTERLTDALEITAMPSRHEIELDVQTARRGIRLMRMHGQDLIDCLLEGGLLYPHACVDGITRNLTRQRRVRDHFVDVVYVVRCRESRDLPGFRDPARTSFCTCLWYARYCNCEHLKYMSWIPTPMLATVAPPPTNISAVRKRGRTLGARVVQPRTKRQRADSTGLLAPATIKDDEATSHTLAEADPGV